MQNSYITFRSRGYVSYSSNDYYLSDRVNKPSPCTCCVFPFNGVPLNPRFFYGFRQSSLVYFPPYKRSVLGGGDGFFRLPSCGFNKGCCGESYSVKNCCQCSCTRRIGCAVWEESCGGCNYGVDCGPVCSGRCYPIKESCQCSGVGRRGKERKLKCVGWEEKSERCDLGIDETVEQMLCLLTEKDDENYVGVKDKKSRLMTERVPAVKRGKGDHKRREKNAESDRLERDLRGKFKSFKKSTEEDYRSLGRKKSSSLDESRELRKDGSNCSSYYSMASSDETVESDMDVHVKHEEFSHKSSSRNKKESRNFKEVVSVKNVIQQTEKNKDDAVGYREVLRQGDDATESTKVKVGSDLHVINEQRNQLMDVSVQQGVSRIESLNRKKGAETTFVSQKRRDNSVSNYSVDDTREQHNQTGSQITQQDSLRIKSRPVMEISQIQDGDSELASSSKTRFRGREENLVASVNLFEGDRDGHSQTGRIIRQSESRRNSQEPSRILGGHDTGIRNPSTPRAHIESTSKNEDQRSTRTFHRAEESGSQIDQLVVWETKSTEESVDLSSIAEVSNNDTVIMNETEAFGGTMSSQEKTSGPSVPGMSKNHDSDIRTSTSQRLSESSWKNRHESSTSLRSSFHNTEYQNRTDQSAVWEQSSTKDSEDQTNISRTMVSNTEIVGDSHKHHERRTSPREEISVSRVDLVQETKKTQQETEHRIKQLELRKEFDRPTETSSFWKSSVNRASSSQQLNPSQQASGKQLNECKENERNSPVMVTPPPSQTIHVTPQDTVCYPKFTSKNAKGEVYSEMPGSGSNTLGTQEIMPFSPDNFNGGIRKDNIDEDQSVILFHEDAFGSASHLEESSAQFVRQLVENLSHEVSTSELPDKKMLPETTSSTKDAEGEVYSEMPGSGSSTLGTQEITLFSPDNLNSGIRKDNIDEDQSVIMFHEDAFGSASRLEESSAQFVRQLVENLSHEVSTSELPDKKMLPETTLSSKDTECTQQSSNQATTEIIHPQVDDSRRSSSRSGKRGPSDEIWDVAGSFSEETGMSKAPSEVNSTTKSAVTKSGRSLWSIIGDIVRLRWGVHSETHISTSKSGGKSSSNESVGSEAWFSSHETDEKADESAKKARKNMPKVHESSGQRSLVKAGTLNLKGALEGTNSSNQILHIEGDEVSSLDAQEGSSASKSASSSSKPESISQKLNERGSQMPPLTTTASSSSSLPSRHLIRSPAVTGEIAESSKGSVSRSDILQMEQPIRESQTDPIGTEVKDAELKRRKLQRKKQVEKEHFEEWEEAYRLESEQRKIDEMFMKEALLEAKKAADTWEVPVGAVLVQHGKIIARGCNLVEDLRDSTAHAEMICIREASKTLRTWRLAETTLYVTLEPCAMCAGAILQARIDTVVYGAPNKLLGADGSWVRLFPGGSEGGSSDLTSQSAGPVHPFHPKITIRRGVLATECADVMQQFFQLRRKDKRSNSPPTSSLPISNHPSKFVSKMHDIFSIMFCL